MAKFINTFKDPAKGVLYPCPCCGEQTLPSRGHFDLCPVCDWEDDGQDDHDADRVRGGPNGHESLTSAREKYRQSQKQAPTNIEKKRHDC